MADTPPLAGLGILVTRPEHQAADLCRLLEAAGASTHRFPGVVIAPTAAAPRNTPQTDPPAVFDLIIFTSANAVRFGDRVLAQRQHAAIAAIGPATAHALERAGTRVSVMAGGGFDSEHLLADPRMSSLSGQRILLVKGRGGRELLEQTLLQRGATVDTAEVYERRIPAPDPAVLSLLETKFATGAIQLITATSLEIARNLFSLASAGLRGHFQAGRWIAPSERVASGIIDLGVRAPIIRASSAEDQELLGAVLRWRSIESDA